MDIRIHLSQPIKKIPTTITGSKSETNRLLLLQALFSGISIENMSQSDDSDVMQRALSSGADVIDIHHAGTAMRFLTAYFAQLEGRKVLITGSLRMKERPIGILVAALRSLGAHIEYTEEEGYPPLKITGKKLKGTKVSIKADVSSQYITALQLIGTKLDNGLELTLEGKITSTPYIKMTLALLAQAGFATSFVENSITVHPSKNQKIEPRTFVVESDWSSASYFYSIVALSPVGTEVALSTYKQDSLQGDSALADIYVRMGVETIFEGDTIRLRRNGIVPKTISFKLDETPDIAQTIAVTCFGLGIGCTLTGLHTLKIKETDRLEALKTELEKLGAVVNVTADSLFLTAREMTISIKNWEHPVDTYNDHRMAMAFAPLAVIAPIKIRNSEVVSKSYPLFWKDLQSLGFSVEEV
ncbi:MAG: 3-phosphoshikimate 1-carboxyvinyltransferase [Flavobacterium sp.]|nr:MAG: 3-phosphoshikimate 1-carboxyvinyltransferase [Flavobacterium sp.]